MHTESAPESMKSYWKSFYNYRLYNNNNNNNIITIIHDLPYIWGHN